MTTRSQKYPPIADHGLVGDLRTAALVSLNGNIDWFCSPRFDSPSVFASLLDAERGGHFQLTCTDKNAVIKQLYFVDTAILITRYLTSEGVGEVIDFMPIDSPEGRAIPVMCGLPESFADPSHSSWSAHRGSTTAVSSISLNSGITTHCSHRRTWRCRFTQQVLDHSRGKHISGGDAHQQFTLRRRDFGLHPHDGTRGIHSGRYLLVELSDTSRTPSGSGVTGC